MKIASETGQFNRFHATAENKSRFALFWLLESQGTHDLEDSTENARAHSSIQIMLIKYSRKPLIFFNKNNNIPYSLT